MAGNLGRLAEQSERVAIQDTAFTLDATGRYVCSLWSEAVDASGAGFDAVVIGAGMYGAYAATKIFRLGEAQNKRVLLLEAGPLLITEHIQNLAQLGFNVPGPIAPASDPGIARELVWGLPWRGQDAFPGLAYCIGGKSLYWGGWCPRLTGADLARWPPEVAAYLEDTYPFVEDEVGVSQTTDFITGPLYAALNARFQAATPAVPHIELALGMSGIEPAPLAVQGSPPASGLFSFDKFSSAPLLIDALREDAARSGGNDHQRRFFLVPRAHVTRLVRNGDRVTALQVNVRGENKELAIAPHCNVVIALSAIETTRLALASFPTALMGRNLMAHLRTDFTVRIRRAVFGALPAILQTGALLVRGVAPQGRFHIQVTAAANPASDSDQLLFRMVPDLDALRPLLENQDSDWIAITLRGIAEMQPDHLFSPPNGRSWINLSPYEYDEFGVPRAFVQITPSANDLQLWQTMDETILALVSQVAGSAVNIEYLYDGAWRSAPPPLDRPFPDWHRGLGTTYHESGTLWMGTDPSASVTNTNGRFHHIANAYACDQSLFPTVGSVNPVLTGLALARRIAETLVV